MAERSFKAQVEDLKLGPAWARSAATRARRFLT
jgi:hypothetical protein